MVDSGLPYIGKILNDSFYRHAEKRGSIPEWPAALDRTYEPSSQEWQAFVQALKDIKSMSDELGLPPPLFAVLNSENPDSQNAYPKQRRRWFEQVEKAAADSGFIAYNHTAEIPKDLQYEWLIVNQMDSHPSALLNRIYGEKLYRQIASVVMPQR
jgi:hypothetical protein